MSKTYSVTELNNYIKSIFESDYTLKFIDIEGELSDVKKYPSGHLYFTLIDENSRINAVMFSFENKFLNFTPKSGDNVHIKGSVSVYPKNGNYQLYVKKMELTGDGLKLLQLKILTEKLFKEGLFDESRKRKINLYPNAIGLITGKGSAASSDLITNIQRRYPIVKIYTFYCLVQGDEAPKDIIKALNIAYKYPLDTIIIGRGGGATEDLSAFNDENVVRVAAKSKIPIISAVGHEINQSLIDYVADKRASTPTGAAEFATIDKREIYENLDSYYKTLFEIVDTKIKFYKKEIDIYKNRPIFLSPKIIYENKINSLNIIKNKLTMNISSKLNELKLNISDLNIKLLNSYKNYLNNLSNSLKTYDVGLSNVLKNNLILKRNELNVLKEKLININPIKILNRGYTLIKNKNDKIIKSVNDVNLNEEIITYFKDGKLISKAIKKEKDYGG